MKANREDLLPAMIEDGKKQSAEYRAKADALDSLVMGWEEELIQFTSNSTYVFPRRREVKRSREKESNRSSPVGEKQKNLQDVIETLFVESKRPMKTAEIREAMGLKGHDLSQNYVGTLLSRGQQFSLLSGGKWILSTLQADTKPTGEAAPEVPNEAVKESDSSYFPDEVDISDSTPKRPTGIMKRPEVTTPQRPQQPVSRVAQPLRPVQPVYPTDDFDDSDPFADK